MADLVEDGHGSGNNRMNFGGCSLDWAFSCRVSHIGEREGDVYSSNSDHIFPKNSTSRELKIQWLQDVLKETFFKKCGKKHHNRKEDFYCFDCKLRLCWYCIINDPTHTTLHNHIRIHRYYTKSSLSTVDVQRLNLIDISDIKDYKSGGNRLVLFHGNQKSSRSVEYIPKCQNCHSVIHELDVGYCSLACKVSKLFPEREIGSSVHAVSNPNQPLDLTEEIWILPSMSQKRRKMSSS